MEKDIGKIKKNDATNILIRIDDFGGKKGLTIREYITSEKYTGFSKAGTRIPAEGFKDFKALINSINESDLQQEPAAQPAASSQKKSKKKIEDSPKEEVI